ncbi:hypothetical protein [Candidatus Poriferisodalis multihospitum]|uniref:hypothetical protein n=1 Tax=Candidatus Poriferisodalis multihospitum TaxID=2983191 RepID=UPI00238CA245|nr:hypothetical protein [Candidatus Poriferisodalis multihospitum]MDE0135592.1 hypothetical protein [Acidimicrobiaceae bacterium]MDE0318699.1 hypothetical protein [Acidimicrobiaceae bacterium]
MRKRWSRPAVVSAAGLLLAIVGLVVSNAWGGVDSIQAATSSEEFATLAHEQGNQVRWASWADIVLIVPGYGMFLGGLLAVLRGDDPKPRSQRVAAVGRMVLVAAVVSDQTENAMLQLGMGGVDLDGPVSDAAVDPSGWLIGVLQAAFWAKWVLLLGSVAAVVTLAVTRRADKAGASAAAI